MPPHLFTQNVQTHVQCFETLYRLHFLVWKNFAGIFFGRKTEFSGEIFVLKIGREIGNGQRYREFFSSLQAHRPYITSAIIFARYE